MWEPTPGEVRSLLQKGVYRGLGGLGGFRVSGNLKGSIRAPVGFDYKVLQGLL